MEYTLGVLLVVLVVVLFCRELTCWYLKINSLLEVLEEMRDYMKAWEAERVGESKAKALPDSVANARSRA